MEIEQHVFPTPHDPEMKMAAKCYTIHNSVKNEHGLTLLFAHCTGSHKEQWEPVIQHVFEQTKGEPHPIREIWAFDWQSHGDSAVLNRKVLENRPPLVSVVEWARAIAWFVLSPRMKGHRIIPIGHSAGATAIMLTTQHIPLNKIPYIAMILIEPTMVTREVFNLGLDDRMAHMDFAVSTTNARRDSWKSKSHASDFFAKRFPFEYWSPRIVDLLVEHGLEELPGGELKLKCDRKHEAASFQDVESHFEGALQFGRVCNIIPIHIVWGDRNDLVPDFIQESLSDVTEGRTAASITKIEDAGHMLLQEQPDRLAQAVSDIIGSISVKTAAKKSKL